MACVFPRLDTLIWGVVCEGPYPRDFAELKVTGDSFLTSMHPYVYDLSGRASVLV